MDESMFPSLGPAYQTDFGFSSLPTGYQPVPAGLSAMPGTPKGGWEPSAWERAMGYTNPETGMQGAGWGGLALGTVQGIFDGWLGMEKLDLAKQSLAENKRQFEKNWQAQKGLVNSDLEARQRARVANRPDAYRSVGDYMQTYGVK